MKLRRFGDSRPTTSETDIRRTRPKNIFGEEQQDPLDTTEGIRRTQNHNLSSTSTVSAENSLRPTNKFITPRPERLGRQQPRNNIGKVCRKLAVNN